MNKKFLVVMSFIAMTFTAFAQDDRTDEDTRLFKRSNLFTGGSVVASFYSGATMLGVIPHFGYSVNKYVDVALSCNVNYLSQRDSYTINDKTRQTIIGPGAFVRLYPIKFLFAHAGVERNSIKLRYIYPSGTNLPDETIKLSSNSVLVGGGYCTGRDEESRMHYYVSVLWDIAKDKNSPYTDSENRPIPIYRAGVQIKLFQGKYNSFR